MNRHRPGCHPLFIEEYPGAVPADLCARIIAKFESDPARAPSTVGNAGTVSNVRTGTLLRVDMNAPDWQPLLQPLVPPLQQTLERYAAKYAAIRSLMDQEGLVCTFPPLIERVDPGQSFDWHYDNTALFTQRVLACLLYLCDVRGGGTTDFKEQRRNVASAVGKIVLFPPYWTHMHRGATPTKDIKYVMSCFWQYPQRTAEPEPKKGLAGRLVGWANTRLSSGK